MKKFTLLLLIFPSIYFSQSKTALIEYFVPISNDIKKTYFTEEGKEVFKYCSRIVPPNSSPSLTNYSFLNKKSREIIYKNIFGKAKNGELVVYYIDNYYWPISYQVRLENKIVLPSQEAKKNSSYHDTRHATDDNGEPLFNDEGEAIIEEYFTECTIDDFVGIKFYEEWTFDYKNLSIDKKILYYAPAIKTFNPESAELVGLKYPFIVENNDLSTIEIIASDFYSNTEIFCDYGTIERMYCNYLEPSVKFPFIEKAMNNNLFYECSPPYNKKIPTTEALSIEVFYDSIDEYGETLLDNNGEIIKVKSREFYGINDINSFGFLEDWFFDQKTSSFKKKVKGTSLEVHNYMYDIDESGMKPIFLLKK